MRGWPGIGGVPVSSNESARKEKKLRILSRQLERMKENSTYYALPLWKRGRLVRRIRRLEAGVTGRQPRVALRLATIGAAALALAACPPDTPVVKTPVANAPAFAAGVKNPFGFTPIAADMPVAPAFVDIDKDGDADLFAGAGAESTGTIEYYKNDGSVTSPSFAAGALYANLPDGVAWCPGNPVPVFAPIYGGSDWTLFIGEEPSGIQYPTNFLRQFDNTNGVFTEASSLVANLPQTDNNYGGWTVTFADLNGDKLLDAVMSRTDGTYNSDTSQIDYSANVISYYLNTGTSADPVFTDQSTNLGLVIPSGKLAFPAFVDIDADGDYDAFIGDDQGNIQYYENTGTATAPVFAAAKANPFGIVAVPSGPAVPAFVDIDNDGDYDLFVGDKNGDIWFFENKNL
jgi:hypothetical protein